MTVWETFMHFLKRQSDIKKTKGVLAFITPTKWMCGYGKSLRNYFLKHTLSPYVV